MIVETKSGAVVGNFGWKKDEEELHLHLNGRLGRRKEDDDDAYDAHFYLATPFTSLKNVSFNLAYANIFSIIILADSIDCFWCIYICMYGSPVHYFPCRLDP